MSALEEELSTPPTIFYFCLFRWPNAGQQKQSSDKDRNGSIAEQEDPSEKDREEDSAEREKILYFYPKTFPLQEQLKQIGLCQGIMSFTRFYFSNKKSYSNQWKDRSMTIRVANPFDLKNIA